MKLNKTENVFFAKSSFNCYKSHLTSFLKSYPNLILFNVLTNLFWTKFLLINVYSKIIQAAGNIVATA